MRMNHSDWKSINCLLSDPTFKDISFISNFFKLHLLSQTSCHQVMASVWSLIVSYSQSTLSSGGHMSYPRGRLIPVQFIIRTQLKCSCQDCLSYSPNACKLEMSGSVLFEDPILSARWSQPNTQGSWSSCFAGSRGTANKAVAKLAVIPLWLPWSQILNALKLKVWLCQGEESDACGKIHGAGILAPWLLWLAFPRGEFSPFPEEVHSLVWRRPGKKWLQWDWVGKTFLLA